MHEKMTPKFVLALFFPLLLMSLHNDNWSSVNVCLVSSSLNPSMGRSMISQTEKGKLSSRALRSSRVSRCELKNPVEAEEAGLNMAVAPSRNSAG